MVEQQDIQQLIEFVEKGNNVIIYNSGGLIVDIKNPNISGTEYYISMSNELSKINVFTDVIEKITFEDGCVVIEIKKSEFKGTLI